MSKQLHMAAQAPHSAARLLPAPLIANGPEQQKCSSSTLAWPLPFQTCQMNAFKSFPGVSCCLDELQPAMLPQAAAEVEVSARPDPEAAQPECPAPQGPGTPTGGENASF